MRQLVIVAAFVIVLAYCYKVGERYTYVDVPAYRTVQVDLLGGKTWAAYQQDTLHQTENLSELGTRRLEPPHDGLTLADGTEYAPDHRLKGKDFETIINAIAAKDQNFTIELRDPADVLALEAKHFRIRNPMPKAGFHGGEDLDQEAIAKLIDAGVEKVAVVGQGDVVAAHMGTMAMVIVIFVALVMALRGTLWDPVLAILDERRRELEEGRRLARDNSSEADRVEKEANRLRAEARREYMDKLGKARGEAMREGEAILNESRDKAHALEKETLAKLDEEMARARQELEREVPALGRAVSEAVLGREVKEN